MYIMRGPGRLTDLHTVHESVVSHLKLFKCHPCNGLRIPWSCETLQNRLPVEKHD